MPASGRNRTLPGAVRAQLEREIEARIESLIGESDVLPRDLGDLLAELIVPALARAGLEDSPVASLRSVSVRLAASYSKCFAKTAGATQLITQPDPIDVMDQITAWARIAWLDVDAARDAWRVASLAAARAATDAESIPSAWWNWITDNDLRAKLLARKDVYAPRLRSLVTEPALDGNRFALLCLLGDPDAAEKLAASFGDLQRADESVTTLERIARQRMPAPVPSVRIAQQLRRLPVDSPTAWRVAALCVRRLPKAEIGARIPSLGRLLEAARASPPGDAVPARALRDAAAKQGIAEA